MLAQDRCGMSGSHVNLGVVRSTGYGPKRSKGFASGVGVRAELMTSLIRSLDLGVTSSRTAWGQTA